MEQLSNIQLQHDLKLLEEKIKEDAERAYYLQFQYLNDLLDSDEIIKSEIDKANDTLDDLQEKLEYEYPVQLKELEDEIARRELNGIFIYTQSELESFGQMKLDFEQ